ncbi:Translin-associated protein X [Cyphellophora attinorum]|uniref:Translin-associated protein X n=1 Tax=Cyphellophora attinorum TaxID=1664694 RepID=A0A0N1H8N8_9EURO|nr:Translin-associated protein X [Phialophora attinorum]KPI39592.1 Translin-associated protein X [Phialophora attinorum]
MAGVKRKSEDMDPAPNGGARASPYMPMFETFRAELDEHHDRRERINKASRDVTGLSKKIIFNLQRTREIGQPTHVSITKVIDPMYASIKKILESFVPDLEGINAHRYHYNISPGIQEFMEAYLFHAYLQTQRIPTHPEAAAALPEGIRLTQEDYLLGLFDTTGEMMRWCITYMATNGKLPGGGQGGMGVLADMQAIRGFLEGMDVKGSRDLKSFDNKLTVTRQSVEKVENGVYSMLVRGKERPKGWRPDAAADGRRDGPEEVESY